MCTTNCLPLVNMHFPFERMRSVVVAYRVYFIQCSVVLGISVLLLLIMVTGHSIGKWGSETVCLISYDCRCYFFWVVWEVNVKALDAFFVCEILIWP